MLMSREIVVSTYLICTFRNNLHRYERTIEIFNKCRGEIYKVSLIFKLSSAGFRSFKNKFYRLFSFLIFSEGLNGVGLRTTPQKVITPILVS